MAAPTPRFRPLARGLRGVCPNCGGRGIFRSVANLQDACPRCRYSFVREDGYWVGAMTVNMAIVLATFGTWFIGGMVVTWPDVPWTGLLIGGIVVNATVPFLLYGWSKSVWVGLDMSFNPANAHEFLPADPDAVD